MTSFTKSGKVSLMTTRCVALLNRLAGSNAIAMKSLLESNLLAHVTIPMPCNWKTPGAVAPVANWTGLFEFRVHFITMTLS